LETISHGKYEYLFRQLSAQGYRKCEPVPLPAEEAEMCRELFGVYYEAHARSFEGVAESLGMLEDELRSDYWRALFGLRLMA
jgi:hypothetical protein